MKLFIVLYIIIIAIGSIFYIGFCTILELERNFVQAEISVPRTDCRKYNKMLSVLDAVNPADYKNPGNNCYDQSKQMQQSFREIGIESSIFITRNRAHAFLGIWIDPVYGSFIKPGTPYDVMEIRKTPNQVICSNE